MSFGQQELSVHRPLSANDKCKFVHLYAKINRAIGTHLNNGLGLRSILGLNTALLPVQVIQKAQSHNCRLKDLSYLAAYLSDEAPTSMSYPLRSSVDNIVFDEDEGATAVRLRLANRKLADEKYGMIRAIEEVSGRDAETGLQSQVLLGNIAPEHRQVVSEILLEELPGKLEFNPVQLGGRLLLAAENQAS